MKAALAPLIFAAFLAGCATFAPYRGDVLAIGDSVLAWNGGTGQSIPDVVARRTGREVFNAAIPGARVSNPSRFASGLGLDIARQFSGDWRDVIFMGGANDLRSECDCSACDGVLTDLIAPDGRSGEIPALAARIRASGAGLTLVGYYGPVDGGGGSFDGCDDELRTLGQRLRRLAATDPGIGFVTARDVFEGAPALYARDRVHPSPEGSARIGALLADALN